MYTVVWLQCVNAVAALIRVFFHTYTLRLRVRLRERQRHRESSGERKRERLCWCPQCVVRGCCREKARAHTAHSAQRTQRSRRVRCFCAQLAAHKPSPHARDTREGWRSAFCWCCTAATIYLTSWYKLTVYLSYTHIRIKQLLALPLHFHFHLCRYSLSELLTRKSFLCLQFIFGVVWICNHIRVSN